jgi:Orsellinic acid/F9775 biosynthesis cluster protein D
MINWMDEYVFVNDEFDVAVCTSCQFGIWGDVAHHFADNHKETWKDHRQELRRHIKRMTLMKKEDAFVNYLEAYQVREPVPCITVLEAWARDEGECLGLSINEVTMSQHC